MAKNRNRQDHAKVSVAQAVRDVLIVSMNKGVFGLALVALVVVVVLYKMPPSDVSKVVFEIGQNLMRWQAAGYCLAAIMSVGWPMHARYQRRQFQQELERVVRERNRFQEQVLKQRLPSSNA